MDSILQLTNTIPGVVGISISPGEDEVPNSSRHTIAGETIRVDWDHEPTAADKALVVPTLTAGLKSSSKLADTNAWWKNVKEAGYTVTSLGPEIGWDDETLQAINQGVTLMKELVDLGELTNDTPFPGWVDRNGVPIKIDDEDPTVGQLRAMCAEAGLQYQMAWSKYRGYLKRISMGMIDFVPGED